MDVSAKSGDGIDDLIHQLIEIAVKQTEDKIATTTTTTTTTAMMTNLTCINDTVKNQDRVFRYPFSAVASDE